MRMAGSCLLNLNKLFRFLLLFAAKLPLSDRIHVYLVLFLLCHNLAIVPHTTTVPATTTFSLLILLINRHLLMV